MAQHGNVASGVQFKLGTAGATSVATDRSDYFDDVKFPRVADEVDITTFGNDGNRIFLPGLKGATFNANGNYDSTIGAHLDAVYNQRKTVVFEYGPIDGATGSPKYTGEFFITNFEIGAKVGDKIPFQCTFRITGGVTLGSYS